MEISDAHENAKKNTRVFIQQSPKNRKILLIFSFVHMYVHHQLYPNKIDSINMGMANFSIHS